jgi:Xaa-Pro aminopeptidase
MRACHVRDGVALTAYFAWLTEKMTQWKEGNEEIATEFEVAEVLESFRRKMEGYVFPSFDTISSFGPNGWFSNFCLSCSLSLF